MELHESNPNPKSSTRKGFLIGLGVGLLILVSATGGALADRLFVIKPLDFISSRIGGPASNLGDFTERVINEENVVIGVTEDVSPSVVTVAAEMPERRVLQFNPFGGGVSSRVEGGQPQDIGSGFVVASDGLIVTNKHVVSDTSVTYSVITKDGQEFAVRQIDRDPNNDIAILKIDAEGLPTVKLGESGNLKAGQFVIAIGTALGEFRHTVTTGVISGLGRGIVAGSAFEGFVEELDDVIQTDAAINPGNSGGPLLNSLGQVIGVNVAVAQGAENIGFAIPIDAVKKSLDEFRKTGNFPQRPFLGVQYQMIDQEGAVLNNVPQGAYVSDVVDGSPAANAGIVEGEIVTKFDGKEVKNAEGGLAELIAQKKVGDSVSIDLWKDGNTRTVTATLSAFSE